MESVDQKVDFDFASLAISSESLFEEWKRDQRSPNVRSFLASLKEALESLSTLSESSLFLFCSHIPNVYRLVAGYPVHRKLILTSLISLWSSGSDAVRLHASVALLKFCKNFPSQHETCARKMYLAFLKATKGIKAHNIHILSLMTNALMEVFSINTDKLCLLVFSSIRKLADLIRVAIKDAKKENLKKVYSWQFCAAIKFWGLLLASSSSEKLDNLVYPTVTLVMELCCIQPSNFYGPFYLQMVRIALDLMEKKQIFIPVNHILGQMLKNICAKKLPVASKISGSAYCVAFMVKAADSDQLNPSYVEALFEDCHTLLMKYISITSTWVCFPEIGLNCQNLLTTVLADCPHKNFRTTLTMSKNKLNQLMEATWKARTDCELPPNSFDSTHVLENFTPVDFKAYVSSLDSIQKLKEKQIQSDIAKAASKAAKSNKSESVKNQSSSKNKKRKINVTKDDDKLVDFEL